MITITYDDDTRALDEKIIAQCWCGHSEVRIPVGWLRAGQTGSCARLGCEPGCEYHDQDLVDPLPTLPARKFNMARFDPRSYDVRIDCSVGHEQSGELVLVTEPGLCTCGCADPVTRRGAAFLMGHDQRLRGKLTRAAAAKLDVCLIAPEGRVLQHLDPIEYATRFNTDKQDWTALVEQAVRRIWQRNDMLEEPVPVVEAEQVSQVA